MICYKSIKTHNKRILIGKKCLANCLPSQGAIHLRIARQFIFDPVGVLCSPILESIVAMNQTRIITYRTAITPSFGKSGYSKDLLDSWFDDFPYSFSIDDWCDRELYDRKKIARQDNAAWGIRPLLEAILSNIMKFCRVSLIIALKRLK